MIESKEFVCLGKVVMGGCLAQAKQTVSPGDSSKLALCTMMLFNSYLFA